MKRIYSLTKIKEFSDLYFKASGFKVPLGYLVTSQVYVCERDGEFKGGFVVGKSNEYKRTIEVFVSVDNKEAMYKQNKDTIEVCCFWMDKNFSASKWSSALCWIQMCWIIFRQKEKQIIWGTNSLGLARVYDLPSRSYCIHIEQSGPRFNYVFKAETNYFLLGVVSVVKNKLFRNTDKRKRMVINYYKK